MSAKTEVIAYAEQNLRTDRLVLTAVEKLVNACNDNGILKIVAEAYKRERPAIVIREDPNAASGAFYDRNANEITINPAGDAADRADMLLFESFNCAHRADYKALSSAFNRMQWPPMYFKDYGDTMSEIEGRVVFKYLTLLREVQKNEPAFPLSLQAKNCLKTNGSIEHESQLVAMMTWTPHDPTGTGDWRFPSPLHYAFRKVMEIPLGQVAPRIKHLVTRAAGGSTWGAYSKVDPDMTFFHWWSDQWTGLPAEARPTAFMSICDEANRVFHSTTVMPGIHWKPISMADYQFDTTMELEARRLSKRSPLRGKADGLPR